ncbi:MAG: hypothetical protein V1776_01815 [Candidatus Diapherotrites archaeon]
MTSHISTETISRDNEKSYFRSMRAKFSGREIITPMKALDASKLQSKININPKAHGFKEIYREITPDKATAIDKDRATHDQFTREMINLENRGDPEETKICFIRYVGKENPFPNQKQIDVLADVAHSFSDITPLPLLDVKISDTTFDRYTDFVKRSYESIEKLNKKPIMGALPHVSRELHRKLIDFYHKIGLTSFYIDFDGQMPTELRTRPIRTQLNDLKILDKSLIYGINAKPGHTLKNQNIVPAKDFLSFGYGVDILGESHVRMKAPKIVFEKMKQAIENQQVNKRRIFFKSDYGYYKTNKKNDLAEIFPNDTGIKLDDILNDNFKTAQKLFNMEQQGIEAAKIKKRLNELDKNETILDYLKGKKYIQSELKLLKAKNNQQKTLSGY